MKKASNKTILFLGLLFIFSAFMCVAAVSYQMIQDRRYKDEEVEDIRRNLVEVKAERTEAQRKARELAARAGQGIEFDRLMSAAHQRHGEEERSRREGDLWIDREGKEWMVTLGALNGLAKGSRLRVMDGDQQIGVVTARAVLDVVSYVDPEDDHGQFQGDLYQVVME